MRSVGLVARADLRRRRGSLIMLALLTALVVAAVLATVAGSRRTASVLDRFMHETAARDLQVTVNSPEFVLEPARVDGLRRRLEALDGVTLASALSIVPMSAQGTPHDFGIMASPDGAYFHAVDQPIVLAGRLPSADAAEEVALNETAASQLGLSVGDRLSGPTYTPEVVAGFVTDNVATDVASGPTVAATVVGVVRTSDELSVHPGTQTPGAVASPAFLRGHTMSGAAATIYAVRVDRSVVREEELRATVRDAVGPYESYVSWVDEDYAGELDSAHGSLAAGLLVAAAVAAVAGTLMIALAVSRQLSTTRDTDAVLRELGVERRQRALTQATPSALAVAAGTVGGVLVAAALSPLFPLSIARRAEVAPGVAVDLVVLGLGGMASLVTMLACVGWSAARSTTSRVSKSAPHPVTVSALRGVRRAGPPAAIGVTMTLTSGAAPRGVPARSAAAGALVGVAGVVGVAVFIASVSASREEAGRFGWTWDSSPDLVSEDPEGVVARMVEDPDLAAVADVSCGPVDLAGTQQYVCAFNDWKRATAAPTIAGRPPTAPTDIALGRATMRQLGVSIGDSVRSGTGDLLTVVGETVIPMLDNSEPGQGAIMTVDGLAEERVADGGRYLLLTYSPGTDPTSLEQRLEADYGVSFTPASRPEAPGRLVQLDLMTGLLRALGAFLVALGVIGLSHFLVVSARRRRHDFAVLRALGFIRRDLSLTTSWQAITVVVAGVVVGAPLGVMIGRWAWLSAIGSVGMIDTPAVPLAVLALIVAVAVAGAAALGSVPGWVAARRSPANELRSE